MTRLSVCLCCCLVIFGCSKSEKAPEPKTEKTAPVQSEAKSTVALSSKCDPEGKGASGFDPRAGVGFVHFGPAGPRAVLASEFMKVESDEKLQVARVYDLTTGKPVTPLMEHSEPVEFVCFSPDGTRVATAAGNAGHIWSVATGKRVASQLLHKRTVKRLAFSPDGTRVATSSYDNTVRIWDAGTGKPLTPPMKHFREFAEYGETPSHIVFSPDGSQLLTVATKHARLWDAKTGTQVHKTELAKGEGPCFGYGCFFPDGKRFVTCGTDNSARVWDATTGKLAYSLTHKGVVKFVTVGPNGQTIGTAARDGTARVWEAQTGNAITADLVHPKPEDYGGPEVNCVVFTQSGARVLTVSGNRTWRVWDAKTGKPESEPVAVKFASIHAVLCPTGNAMITTSFHQIANVWDVKARKLLHEVRIRAE